MSMNRITREDIAPLFERWIALRHDWVVERFRFHPDGRLAATVGTKAGPRTGPQWYWELTKDGRLLITGRRRFLWMVRDLYYEWTGVKCAAHAVTVVEKGGGTKIYDYCPDAGPSAGQ